MCFIKKIVNKIKNNKLVKKIFNNENEEKNTPSINDQNDNWNELKYNVNN